MIESAGASPSLPALQAELEALVDDAQVPLLAVAALALREGRLAWQGHAGWRHPGDAARTPPWPPLPVNADTLFRVASISKLVVAVGVMRLVDAGVLALDADVGRWLGWPLRHPRFADRVVTLRGLLSHRTGLSDGGERYVFDADVDLREVLQPGGRLYADGLNWRADTAPGTRFEYVNLNFGVVATVMEAATGERFDRLMRRLVLQPLSMRGDFDPAALPRTEQQQIATLVRKRRLIGEREVWDPAGPWVVQTDDFRETPARSPAGLQAYRPGRNGTLFGPQGRLRTGVGDLGRLMQMLLDDGRHGGRPFLLPASAAALGQVQWRLADSGTTPAPAGLPSADANDDHWATAWGVGAQVFTDTTGPGRGDRLLRAGGFTGWGHTGDAYGLRGVFALDPVRRDGLVVLVAGPGVDPATQPGRWSAHGYWLERATDAVARHALGRGSEQTSRVSPG